MREKRIFRTGEDTQIYTYSHGFLNKKYLESKITFVLHY